MNSATRPEPSPISSKAPAEPAATHQHKHQHPKIQRSSTATFTHITAAVSCKDAGPGNPGPGAYCISVHSAPNHQSPTNHVTTLEGHLHRTSPQKLHQSAAQQLAIKIQQLQDESDPDADSAFVDTPNHHLSLQVLHHLQSLRVQHRPGIHPGHDPDETREQCQEMADQLAGYARDINIDSHQAWSRNLTGRDDGGPEQDPRDPHNLWQKSWSPGLGKFLVLQRRLPRNRVEVYSYSYGPFFVGGLRQSINSLKIRCTSFLPR